MASLKHKPAMLLALQQELEWRKDYLAGEGLETIYLGGGTPSILLPGEIEGLFQTIYQNYRVEAGAEITLEANPEDIDRPCLHAMKDLGINRLSIGIQSFQDDILRWMNRRHDANTARRSLEFALDAGFENLTADLIYGIPGLSAATWRADLRRLLETGLPHLSAYHLGIEPKTVFGRYLKKGKLQEITEEESLAHYQGLVDITSEYGLEHYEVSNFAVPGYYSNHNMGYWFGKKYLGVGPSAHSYHGESRQWNVANNTRYIQSIKEGQLPFEKEELTISDKINDYLLTRLRTRWGIDLQEMGMQLGQEHAGHCLKYYHDNKGNGLLKRKGHKLILTHRGMFMADHVIGGMAVG
jgi:oxygen-independent coproporphyrinogen-3 oxidase